MVTSVAFTQLNFNVVADFTGGAMTTIRYSGEYNRYDKDNNNSLYLGPGSFSIMSLAPFLPYNIGQPKENELKFNVSYTGENFSGHIRVPLDRYVRADNDRPGFINENGDGFILGNLLTTAIDEWRIEGRIGYFTAWVGHTDNKGVVNNFEAFNELMGGKVDNFGILIPSFARDASNKRPTALINAEMDNNNFRQLYSTLDALTCQSTTFFVLSGKFAPFIVSLAGDLGNHSTIGTAVNINPSGGQADYDPFAFIRGNGGIRVSGENIKDMFNFDLTYKLRGGDQSANKDKYDLPNGEGRWMHSLGLYANILGVENTGIALGYSAMFRTYEDYKGIIADMNNDNEASYFIKSPFWSGINLHLQYIGLQNLIITFNNNVSFASSVGEKDKLNHPLEYARFGRNPAGIRTAYFFLEENEKNSWFALYNGLHVAYKLTNHLTASLMLQNTFSQIKKINNEIIDFESAKTDHFSIAALISYTLGNVLMEGGLVFRNISNTWESDGAKANVSYFSIPLRTRISF